MKKDRRYLVGIASTLALIGGLCLTGELVATSSTDYKGMVDGIFGVNNSSASGDASSYAFKSSFNNTTDVYTKRAQISAQIGEEGCVLLKNKKIQTNEEMSLPLKNNAKVTILGSRAYTYDTNGNLRDSHLSVYGGIVGSKIYRQKFNTPNGVVDVPITLIDGLEKEHISVNPEGVQVYTGKPYPQEVSGSEANGSQGGPFSIREPKVNIGEFHQYQNYKDAVIVVIGRTSGEGREYFPGTNGIDDKTDGSKSALNLSNDERDLIRLAHQMSDNVVVLLNSAVAMEINDLKDGTELGDMVNSVMWIGLPGCYGMEGVGRVLSGSSSPSGHLSDTWAVDASMSPAAQNFGVTAMDNSGNFSWSNNPDGYYSKADNSHYVVLAEDIYTGYKYYETRYMDTIEGRGNASSAVGKGREATSNAWKYEDEMAYTFGYGLSYTTFDQKFETFDNGKKYLYDANEHSLTFKVTVTNTGNVPGKDVVQVYGQSPYTQYDVDHAVEKAAVQLLTFDKTQVLLPGASETIELTANLKYLASYDKTANHDGVTGGYILENDNYYIGLGNGAHEALNQILYKKDNGNANKIYKDGNYELTEQKAISWNPANDKELTESNRGAFVNDINATLLNLREYEKEDNVYIQNQMVDTDYNYFKSNTITYLTRSHWDTTFPKPYTGLELTSGMRKALGTSANDAGRLYDFTTGTSDVTFGVDHESEEDEEGNPLPNKSIAEYKGYAYEDESWDYLLEEITFDEAWKFAPYGGASCKAFLSVNSPDIWQIDGPNGNVTRGVYDKANRSGEMAVSPNDPYANYLTADMPAEPTIAATFNPDLLYEEGESFGEDALYSRNTIAWAPGMNLHRTPFNSRNHEYYSEDAMLTNICGRKFVEGGLSKGAILSAKHFAFNTQESYREGLVQFMEEQSSRELELRGFQGPLEDAGYINSNGNKIGALGIMTSFSRAGVTGINAHTGVMKNILRKEWAFRGLSSTDMVVAGRFFNPQDCVINNVTFMATSNAENLLSNFWPDYNNKAKVKGDPNLMKALYQNMHYYMYAVANSSALNGYAAGVKVAAAGMSYWEGYLYAGMGVMATISAALFGVYTYLHFKKEN